MKAPLGAADALAKQPALAPTFAYDLPTKAGKTYTLQAAQ